MLNLLKRCILDIATLESVVNLFHKYIMTHFPVQYKPKFETDKFPVMFEYPGVISSDMCEEIINIATNYDGWHRRGSKSKHVQASFTCTLLHDLSHPIYETLDNLWHSFTTENQFNIDFVEFYEVKEYLPGDRFDPHVDTGTRVNEMLERKINLILQLSDGDSYEGGDLVILNQVANRKKGSVIFFPSYYAHHVTQVTNGNRYSLIGHGWGNVNRR